MRAWISGFFRDLWSYRFDRQLMRHFDWPLFLIVLAISLFGVVCIFSASSSSVTEKPATVMEMLETQPLTYARLQLIWVLLGIVAMVAMMYFSYEFFGRMADFFYALNIIMLLSVLFMEAGRGGMTAFFTWGSNSERTFQPSEVGKVAIVIALAKAFSSRMREISHLKDMTLLIIYVGIPLALILAQPDVGTGLVYVAIFAVMVFVSGASWRLIAGAIITAAVLAIPIWYFLNSSVDNFRLTRILIWLNPEAYPEEGAQVLNAQIAVGSGGIWGRGIVSPGSFASLGYISDDHTDFIFAIACESFGMVGAGALVLGYAALLGRLIYLAMKVKDPFGSYLIIGVMALLLAHIVENICMVIGLTPVTGIPLPFLSYGGSNMITNMLGIGLVMNVVMRSRNAEDVQRAPARADKRI